MKTQIIILKNNIFTTNLFLRGLFNKVLMILQRYFISENY